jgi:Methyltransferase domain.
VSTSPEGASDWWAAQYGGATNDTRDRNVGVCRKQNLTASDNDVVEIGCGTRLNTKWLTAQAEHVVATDVSDALLARARASIPSR